MRLFWDRGYEATGVDELSAAMGISTSSLYAAFGDKERLFLEAIDRYMTGVGGFGGPILASSPDARAAIERLMEATACELTRDDQPIGCMVSITLMHSSADAMSVRTELAKRRASAQDRIRGVIQKDIDSGRLPGDCDAGELTAYVAAVIQGMTAQARDGARLKTLLAIARYAMRGWPAP